MTDVAITSAVERIARVLAAEALSPNADGPQGSDIAVSAAVDLRWKAELDRAAAVLRTLREPTAEMVDAGRNAGGDAADMWSAMVRAALGER